MPVRHYTSVTDLTEAETIAVLRRARKLKGRWRESMRPSKRLRGYTLAAIFEKPSLRTRVTFEAGMAQLGGTAVYLGPNDIKLGDRESIADVARNLSRWVQIIVGRTFTHRAVVELSEHSSVPVINALSDWEHPCQVLADFLTIAERFGSLDGRKLAYIGDGNNVAHSLLLMAGLLGMDIAVAGPAGYAPNPGAAEQAQELAQQSGAQITITTDLDEAIVGADVIYTDVWTSMGQESEHAERAAVFPPYQVTDEVLRATGKEETIFMHCLPAHRDEEATAMVIDGPQSVIFDQAENRLHVQKALILFLLDELEA